MKISDLIEQLQCYQESYGDIPVTLRLGLKELELPDDLQYTQRTDKLPEPHLVFYKSTEELKEVGFWQHNTVTYGST